MDKVVAAAFRQYVALLPIATADGATHVGPHPVAGAPMLPWLEGADVQLPFRDTVTDTVYGPLFGASPVNEPVVLVAPPGKSVYVAGLMGDVTLILPVRTVQVGLTAVITGAPTDGTAPILTALEAGEVHPASEAVTV